MSTQNTSLKTQLLWVAGIVIGFFLISLLLIKNKPKVSRHGANNNPKITVEISTIATQPFQIHVSSYGVVKPRTQTNLFSQVSGQIIAVSDAFREGGFFEKGEVLMKIDGRDYQTQLTVSESDLQLAVQNLEEEKARVVQALGDWKRSGKTSPAPELALRKPQLAAAKAQLRAARAKRGQAHLNLERTQIVAPYAGRVLTKNVDIGQVVSPSTLIGEIYAIDYVEIRLPLKNTALKFIQLPENFRHHSIQGTQPKVRFTSDLGDALQSWQGRVVRTEGAIDKNTNQLYVIAQIDDPYSLSKIAKREQAVTLKIGQYLDASISGNLLENAIVIPEKSIYQGSYVYLYKDGKIQRQPVKIAWRDRQQIVISDGLKTGDQLVVTTLGQMTSGTAVRLKQASGDSRTKSNKKRHHNKSRVNRKTPE